jgi:hypothetical protein
LAAAEPNTGSLNQSARKKDRVRMSDQNTPWEARIDCAAKALGTTVEEVQSRLAKMGVTKEAGIEVLDDDEIFKFGDFREEFKDYPIVTQRRAFACLRSSTKKEKAQTGEGLDPRTEQLRALGIKVRINDAPSDVLLSLYLPDRPNDPVTNALKNRFGDIPIIAFRDDGTIAKAEVLQYISDIEQDYPKQDTIVVDSKLTKLWPVGVKPDQMVDEDPLFPGQPLRNGYSVVNNRNWTKIGKQARQLCRIIAERGDIDVNNKEAVLRLLERATPTDPTDTYPSALAEAYAEAELEFRERQKKDDLPKLKVALGSNVKSNNPFGSKRTY